MTTSIPGPRSSEPRSSDDATGDVTGGATGDPAASVLAERYGAPAPWRRRALLAGVAVVVLAFGGWLAWTTYEQSDPPVSSTQIGFSIVDDNSAKAEINVQFRNQSVTGTECTIQAFAADHSLVGEIAFHPRPAPAPQTYEETIQTERRASSVVSVGCTADGEPRPH